MLSHKHRHYWKDWCDGSAWCRCGMTLDDYEKTAEAKKRMEKVIHYHVGKYGPRVCCCGWCKQAGVLFHRLAFGKGDIVERGEVEI